MLLCALVPSRVRIPLPSQRLRVDSENVFFDESGSDWGWGRASCLVVALFCACETLWNRQSLSNLCLLLLAWLPDQTTLYELAGSPAHLPGHSWLYGDQAAHLRLATPDCQARRRSRDCSREASQPPRTSSMHTNGNTQRHLHVLRDLRVSWNKTPCQIDMACMITVDLLFLSAIVFVTSESAVIWRTQGPGTPLAVRERGPCPGPSLCW